MSAIASARLEGAALDAWRSYLQSHASILRALDAELVAEHGMTTRDYEVLLYLAQADDRRLPMSALAESTMLTRSGITRLIDGLVAGGLIDRVAWSDFTFSAIAYAEVILHRMQDQLGIKVAPSKISVKPIRYKHLPTR